MQTIEAQKSRAAWDRATLLISPYLAANVRVCTRCEYGPSRTRRARHQREHESGTEGIRVHCSRGNEIQGWLATLVNVVLTRRFRAGHTGRERGREPDRGIELAAPTHDDR